MIRWAMPPTDDDPALDPVQVEEARRLVERLVPMLGRTETDQGETVTITLTMPKEYALLAAWLVAKADADHAVLSRPIALRTPNGRRTGDWRRAKLGLTFLLGEALNLEWKRLRRLAGIEAAGAVMPDEKQPHDVPSYDPDDPMYATLKDDLPF